MKWKINTSAALDATRSRRRQSLWDSQRALLGISSTMVKSDTYGVEQNQVAPTEYVEAILNGGRKRTVYAQR